MKKVILSLLFIQISILCYCQETTTVFDIARKGTLEQAKDKLKENPNAFNVVNEEGYSPLLIACYRANNEIAKWLIEKGSDIDAKSALGTPLMAAIVKNNNEIAKLLIEKKADVNFADKNGTTALLYATIFKNYEIVSLLINANADYTVKDNRGNSALDYAILSNDDKLIEILKNKKQ